MRALPWTTLPFVFALGFAACSQPTTQECFTDEDCAVGFACADGQCTSAMSSGTGGKSAASGTGSGAAAGNCATPARSPMPQNIQPPCPPTIDVACGACCCESGYTCSGYVDPMDPMGCSFCVPSSDPGFAQFCGMAGEGIPNYCPSDSQCVATDIDPATAYACCPNGQKCNLGASCWK